MKHPTLFTPETLGEYYCGKILRAIPEDTRGNNNINKELLISIKRKGQLP